MKSKQIGNKNIADFKQLNDRVIAEMPSGPSLVIKTNLDPKDATEENPYCQNKKVKDKQAFLDYFEE